MASYSLTDPDFVRLRRAWLAYESMQAEHRKEFVPFEDAMHNPSLPGLQAAAIEVAAARDAWRSAPVKRAG